MPEIRKFRIPLSHRELRMLGKFYVYLSYTEIA